MKASVGEFLFRYRNGLFPVAYLLLFLPGPRLLEEDTMVMAVGLGIAIIGQLLRAITIGLVYVRRGGRNRRVYADSLVVDGVFAHCRNPLYVGNYLILLGLGFLANSLYSLVLVGVLFGTAYHLIIAAEERFLSKQFGEAYRQYCLRTNQIMPRIKGFAETWKKHAFNWPRLIVKEYGSTCAWLAGAILLVGRNQAFAHGNTFSPRRATMTAILLLTVGVCYAIARYLKKSAILIAD